MLSYIRYQHIEKQSVVDEKHLLEKFSQSLRNSIYLEVNNKIIEKIPFV